MQDAEWADVAPTPRVWLGPRGGGSEDGLTAIWGLQALMGREVRNFPGRGWGGMPTPTFSLLLSSGAVHTPSLCLTHKYPPPTATFLVPTSHIGPPLGSEPTILRHRLWFGGFFTYILFFVLYSKILFSIVSFD